MFDFAWSELALIAVVALVVIGPKDLPRVMRTVGFWVRKARTVAHEFQTSLEQMVRESELEEIRQKVDKATSFNVEEEIAKHIDPHGELHKGLSDPVLKNPLADPPRLDPPQPTESSGAPPARETPAQANAAPSEPTRHSA